MCLTVSYTPITHNSHIDISHNPHTLTQESHPPQHEQPCSNNVVDETPVTFIGKSYSNITLIYNESKANLVS